MLKRVSLLSKHLKSPVNSAALRKNVGIFATSTAPISVYTRPSPTMIPTVDPVGLHRLAIERAMSKKVATGKKIAPAELRTTATPEFKTVPQTIVKNTNNEAVDLIDLNPYFFDCKPKKHILHQMVVWQLAKRRQGTHKTKYRYEVAFTKKKMYAQKGTGRARHGDKGAPIFKKGGHAHPVRPRDYSFKLNKRVRRTALRMALTAKYLQGKLVVVDSIKIDTPKTKAVQAIYNKLEIQEKGGALVIGPETLDENLQRATLNVEYVDFLAAPGLNVYDMLRKDKLILTKDALAYLDKKYEQYIQLNE